MLARLFLTTCLIGLLSTASRSSAQDASLENEARALYQAGVSAYDGGRYEEALRYFQMSYEKSGRPELLYNIASAAERVREDELALRSYEAFIEALPNSEIRARVETRIAVLRKQLERSGVATAPRTEPPPPTDASSEEQPPQTSRRAARKAEREKAAAEREPPAIELEASESDELKPSDFRLVPWLMVGSGAAVLVVGGVLTGLGLGDRAKVENPSDDTFWTDGADRAYERGPARITTGLILMPAGAALAAVGVVLAVKKPSDSEGVSVRIGPGTLQLSGRF
jgi:tetratricopeptide (TPR) repeat protein